MSRDSVLARGQAAAVASMVDTCTIRRVTGTSTNQDTGVITPAYTTVYAGKCRTQQRASIARQHDAGEDQELLLMLEVQIPMAVTGVLVGDEVLISASRDADLIGRSFLVRELAHKTDASARRIGVTERTT